METGKSKISTFQFFSLLFLTRILTTVTYIPAYAEGILSSDKIVQIAFRFVIGLIISVPTFVLLKRNPEMNVIEIAGKKSAFCGKTVALLYTFVLFYYTVATVSRLDVFTGTIVFPETNVNYFLVLVVIICCYGAYSGFEALGRSSVLSLVLVSVALAFVLTTLIPKIDTMNYTPVFYNGVTSVLKAGVNGVGRTIEFVIIAVALPRTVGNKRKSFLIWMISLAVVTALIFFVEIGVMGNFANTQLFPIHSLAALAEFSMFERLDALVTGIWLLCAFLKISILIYLQTDILSRQFPKIKRQTVLFIIGVSVSAICYYISLSVKRFMIVDDTALKSCVVLSAAFLLPLIILIFDRGEKLCKK